MLKRVLRPIAMPVAAFVALCLAVTLAPVGGASAGSQVKPKRFVTGWLPYWNTDGAIRSVKNNASVFDDASPFVFNTLATRRIDLEISADSWRKMRSALRTSGVDNIPTVATDMSAADFAWILRSADRRTAHVRALVSLVDRYNLDGIDLDYESINFGSSTDKNTIREKYPLLVRQLNERLNKLGAVTSVTVASRTSTKDPNWWVFDYRALGAAADRIRLMTYDFSWSGGPAGPIAPKWWVRDVAAYASSVIEPSKISLGMPAYGRDWYHHTISGKCSSAAKNTISRTTRQMNAFARNLGKTPEWRERQSSQTFTYTRTYRSDGRSCKVQRVVWFDDARSLEAKVPLVEQYSLRGIAIWALGNEGAGTWSGLTSYGRQLARSR